MDDQTFCGRSTNLQDQSLDRRLQILISCIHHTNDFRHCCHAGRTAQHCGLGLFQDSDFAGELERRKINLRESFMYLWKPKICPHQSDVQEANFCLAQFCRVRNHFSGCWITHDGLPALDLWDIVIEVLRSTNNTVKPNHVSIRETCAGHNPKPRPQLTKENKRLINCLRVGAERFR